MEAIKELQRMGFSAKYNKEKNSISFHRKNGMDGVNIDRFNFLTRIVSKCELAAALYIEKGIEKQYPITSDDIYKRLDGTGVCSV